MLILDGVRSPESATRLRALGYKHAKFICSTEGINPEGPAKAKENQGLPKKTKAKVKKPAARKKAGKKPAPKPAKKPAKKAVRSKPKPIPPPQSALLDRIRTSLEDDKAEDIVTINLTDRSSLCDPGGDRVGPLHPAM